MPGREDNLAAGQRRVHLVQLVLHLEVQPGHEPGGAGVLARRRERHIQHAARVHRPEFQAHQEFQEPVLVQVLRDSRLVHGQQGQERQRQGAVVLRVRRGEPEEDAQHSARNVQGQDERLYKPSRQDAHRRAQQAELRVRDRLRENPERQEDGRVPLHVHGASGRRLVSGARGVRRGGQGPPGKREGLLREPRRRAAAHIRAHEVGVGGAERGGEDRLLADDIRED